MPRIGVLFTGFGGPDSLDAVGPFMCNLMGREPSPELVDRVCARYLAIGGRSPLPEIADAIARRVGEQLAALGVDVKTAVGMRYWHPYIDAAMEELKEAGCEKIVTVSLSPFESKVASDAYREAVTEAAEKLDLPVIEAPLISELDAFPEFLSSGTAVALSDLQPNEGAIIAFTAHSLPLSDLVEDDPYVSGIRAVAAEVAASLGLGEGVDDAGHPMFENFRTFGSSQLPRAWYLVWQSKGNKPGEWLGPDLDELIDACIEAKVPALVVAPVGFVTDHMETLYDLDIVAADRAMKGGVEFMRAPVPNDADELVEAIARSIAALDL